MAPPSISLCARCLAKPTNLGLSRKYTSLAKGHAILPQSTPSRRVLRRSVHTPDFNAFVPPSPSSLPKPAPPKYYPRTRKWTRRIIYITLGGIAIYGVDKYFLYASITRTLRTFLTSLITGLDYKINFRPHPWFVESLPALHARNAERLFSLLQTNGGLYLKIGQAIAMQVVYLPWKIGSRVAEILYSRRSCLPNFKRCFPKCSMMHPKTIGKRSSASYKRILASPPRRSLASALWQILRKESWKELPERVQASLKSIGPNYKTGERLPSKFKKERLPDSWVSIFGHSSIHPTFPDPGVEVLKFVSDRVVARIYTWLFELPLYSLVPYISERLRLETDFINEADNSERMAKLVAGESRLRGRVYVPKVYRELSSRRIMTAEWIEGVRLWDKQVLTRPWQGSRRQGSPGSGGKPLDPPNEKAIAEIIRNHPEKEHLKPNREVWRGVNGKGGLGVSLKDVMTTMVDLFSAQMFLWGWVRLNLPFLRHIKLNVNRFTATRIQVTSSSEGCLRGSQSWS